MRVQELKSSSGVLYSVQSTLLEAGGQVGEVPVAVSRVWHPGAPRGGGCVRLRSESASALAQFAGAAWADACEFMRSGWAPPFGVCIRRSALEGSPASFGKKKQKNCGDDTANTWPSLNWGGHFFLLILKIIVLKLLN